MISVEEAIHYEQLANGQTFYEFIQVRARGKNGSGKRILMMMIRYCIRNIMKQIFNLISIIFLYELELWSENLIFLKRMGFWNSNKNS